MTSRAAELLAPRGLRCALAGSVLIAVLVACGADGETIELEGPAAEGQQLAQQFGCMGCHGGANGYGGVAPGWDATLGDEVTLDDGTKVVYDEEYLRTAIRDPDAQRPEGDWPRMPAYSEDQISEDELAALVAYLEALASP